MHKMFCIVFGQRTISFPAVSVHILLIVFRLDDNCVFAANLGTLQRTSFEHSRMWICWRILPSSETR